MYERTSGYVHLSDVHLLSVMSIADESEAKRSFTIKISEEDKPLPEWIYIEAVDGFRAATDILLRYIRGWVFTKANPELVQKWKYERGAHQNGGETVAD